MKIAFAFCCDKKFKKGLNLLYKTLVYHNPFVLKSDFFLISDEIDKYKNFKVLKSYDHEFSINTHMPRFRKTFYKFKSFSLDEYDRVIFIDSDIVCLGDISLFVSEHVSEHCFYAARDEGIFLNSCNINSGVMIINKPLLSNKTFLDLISIAKKGFLSEEKDLHGNGSDQFVINYYLKEKNINFGLLEMKYNTLKRIYLEHKNIWESIKDEIRLLHFVGCKPCEKECYENKNGNKYKKLNDLWLSMSKNYI